jgi:hypothetical protein
MYENTARYNFAIALAVTEVYLTHMSNVGLVGKVNKASSLNINPYFHSEVAAGEYIGASLTIDAYSDTMRLEGTFTLFGEVVETRFLTADFLCGRDSRTFDEALLYYRTIVLSMVGFGREEIYDYIHVNSLVSLEDECREAAVKACSSLNVEDTTNV